MGLPSDHIGDGQQRRRALPRVLGRSEAHAGRWARENMRLRHIVVLIIFGLWPWHRASAEAKADEPRPRPLTIAASSEGLFPKGNSWSLSVNSAGEAELVVDTWPQLLRRKFNVTQEQLRRLSDTLDKVGFFELKDEYGQLVPDASTDTLTIVRGGKAKTIRIMYLSNWLWYDKELLREPAKVVRVFNIVRNWFEEPEAVDNRKYNQMILDAVERLTNAQPSAAG